MIKIRLHGTAEEISAAVDFFDRMERAGLLKILALSEVYKDRGKSNYLRLYMDVNIYA